MARILYFDIDSNEEIGTEWVKFLPIKKLKKDKCPNCGKEKLSYSLLCKPCNAKRKEMHPEKIIWPDKETLEKLVWEKPSRLIAKEFGVSDSSITKKCKSYGILKPGPGYWRKKETGNL